MLGLNRPDWRRLSRLPSSVAWHAKTWTRNVRDTVLVLESWNVERNISCSRQPSSRSGSILVHSSTSLRSIALMRALVRTLATYSSMREFEGAS